MSSIGIEWKKRFTITPENPPNDGLIFADMQKQNRSSHLGHALVEYAPGCILGLYPNCDSSNYGHNGNGWMEYRRSTDGGETWSEPIPLPYSKQLYDDDVGRTAMCEKAILTNDGKIILFLLICDMQTNGTYWTPLWEPLITCSADGGQTFDEPRRLCGKRGRVFDVIYRNGRIYVLFNNSGALINNNAEVSSYQIYVSDDNGKSFGLLTNVLFPNTKYCYYGTMEFLPDDRLIIYIYDENDEYNLKYITCSAEGTDWDNPRRAYFARKIRNPQLVCYSGEYFLHGRSGLDNRSESSGHFILYHSIDGINWDNGIYLRMREAGFGAYSNNLLVGARFPGKKQRLLIQSSHAYSDHMTNTLMWWLDKIQ